LQVIIVCISNVYSCLPFLMRWGRSATHPFTSSWASHFPLSSWASHFPLSSWASHFPLSSWAERSGAEGPHRSIVDSVCGILRLTLRMTEDSVCGILRRTEGTPCLTLLRMTKEEGGNSTNKKNTSTLGIGVFMSLWGKKSWVSPPDLIMTSWKGIEAWLKVCVAICCALKLFRVWKITMWLYSIN
jgi:hypothetical protein